MSNAITLEICVDSVESAVAAENGGAHRIELCSNLLEGGVTPGSGLIATIRDRVSIALHVMVRPRGGDFNYTADEFETMQKDVAALRQLGADGLVLGLLHEDGRIDIERTRCLVELARPLKVTFHRAFDMANDLRSALEDVIATGADRVLTSGGQRTVEDGISTVANLVQAAGDRLIILAGGGVTSANVRTIISRTGVREIHASVRVPVRSRMRHRNERVSMGGIKGMEYERFVVTQDRVSDLLDAAASDARPAIEVPSGS
jgi:copper homeostasis protein